VKKCKICGTDYDIVLSNTPLCAKHYVEKEDDECLHWDIVMAKNGAQVGRSKESSERIVAEIEKKLRGKSEKK